MYIAEWSQPVHDQFEPLAITLAGILNAADGVLRYAREMVWDIAATAASPACANARAVGGTAWIRAAPGGGARVELIVPAEPRG